MKIISNTEFAEFLSSKPLYTKIKAVEGLVKYTSGFISHHDFSDKPFKSICPKENDIQTFKTSFGDEFRFISLSTMIRGDENQLPYTFDEKTGMLDLTIHLHGICQSCGHKIDFLIKATSNKKWDDRNLGIDIYLQKIGQFPAYDISVPNFIKKYLTKEDNENYKKALTNLSVSYGIGAYAYFRRITENEIKRIIIDISKLDFNGADLVKEALNNYQRDSQMSKLIDVVNKYLPKSLQELGDNPIRLLYEQLSGGIHEFSDEECINRSQSIDTLLRYVIRKVNEEKYQLEDVRNAMKTLRTNSDNK